MDLKSEYWQIPIIESDCPKSAFLTANGLYLFKVMALGLYTSPGTFQRMMDLVPYGLEFEFFIPERWKNTWGVSKVGLEFLRGKI